MIPKFKYIAVLLCFSCFVFAKSEKIIKISGNDNVDFAYTLNKELASNKDANVKIILDNTTYKCNPACAGGKYVAVTNHGNGYKNILFNPQNLESLVIEGNGAKLLCHGQLMPFLVEKCKNVKIDNLVIDWDIPFTFLGEVIAVNEKEGWRDIKPVKEGFSWTLNKQQIEFPNIDGFKYKYLGSTLPFDKVEKKVVAGAVDFSSRPTSVKQLPNGNLRIFEKLKHYPPVGSLLSSKGDRDNDRYAPAFDFKYCSNVIIDNVTIHHALGMGFLFERSENIKILNSTIGLKKDSNRVISTTADASHFANCKGDILIENCKFSNMLDDGTNVHGTYMSIDKVLDKNSIQVEFKHFEQLGFDFAEAGDKIWFIKSPSPERKELLTVASKRVVNEKYLELTFVEQLPADLKIGDIIENATWNPTFTMRGCTIKNHRARNVVLKTPLKTVIENNNFSSMMSSILFRGESYFWYESGAVTDVLIKNNHFKNCADCGTKHAVLYITPRLGNEFDSKCQYDKNIRFIGNTIDTYLSRLVIAESVDGLVVSDNKINKTVDTTRVVADAPLVELLNCKNVTISNNSYKGEKPNTVLKADEVSRKSLTLKKEFKYIK